MANETRIFRIPPNMPVQAVASHVDHYLRANQGLQVQGASNGEECVLQCRQEKDGWKIWHIVVSTDLSLYRKLFDFQHKTRSGAAAERIRLCTESAGSSSSAASCTDLSKLSDCMRAGKPLLQSLRCTANQTDLPILWRRHHCRT